MKDSKSEPEDGEIEDDDDDDTTMPDRSRTNFPLFPHFLTTLQVSLSQAM